MTPKLDPALIVTHEPWMKHASCRGMETDVFFPESGEPTAAVIAVCAGCPVRSECLDYSMTLPYDTHGVWGGLSQRGRRKWRKRPPEVRTA